MADPTETVSTPPADPQPSEQAASPAKEQTTTSPAPEPTATSPGKEPAATAAASPPAVVVSDPSILPASHWQDEPLPPVQEEDNDDADSAFGSVQSSTVSLTDSILQYRTIHGRTFHSERGRAQAWAPNDDAHSESLDMNHHLCTLTIDGKLHLAPLKDDIQKVLDIGTGTGVWAIDFADAYPSAEVIGTDVSPIQPTWVPPNLKFEIDDANEDEWTWPANTYDYIHIRAMLGSVVDWMAFYRNAYRVCKPGGWIEDYEWSPMFHSDDGSLKEDSPMGQYGKVFFEGGKKFGRTFGVVEEDLQRKGMEAAGFVDVQFRDIKVPAGSWPKDPKMKELGVYSRAIWEGDAEGFAIYIWSTVLGWTREELLVFNAHMKRQVYDTSVHAYYVHRVVWGRKPE